MSDRSVFYEEHNEMHTEKVNVENWTSEEEVDGFDDPVSGRQRRIEREHDRRPGSDKDKARAQSAWRNAVWNASPMITPSAYQDGELSAESSNVTSANLKMVYDVEYRAPD